MKVTTITASVRYSKAQGDGAHKTIELSADATLEPKDNWQEAQMQGWAGCLDRDGYGTLYVTKTRGTTPNHPITAS